MFKKISQKIDKATKSLDTKADKVTREIDATVSAAIGLEDGAKISHAFNTESPHHKDAVQGLKWLFAGKQDSKMSDHPMTSDKPLATEPVLEECVLNNDVAPVIDLSSQEMNVAAEVPTPLEEIATFPIASEDTSADDVYVIGNIYGDEGKEG